MNKAVTAVCLIVMLAFTISLAAIPARAGYLEAVGVVWGTAEEPLLATPGDKDAKLTVTLQNLRTPDKGEADFVMCGIVATLKGYPFKEYPFRDVSEHEEAMAYFSDSLSFGKTATFQFRLNIDENAKPGVYDAVLTVSYFKCGVQDSTQYTLYTYSMPIRVKVWPPPDLNIVDVSWEDGSGRVISAGPGSNGLTLSITIHNPPQNYMYDVKGTLLLAYPFIDPANLGTANASISGTVQPNQAFTLKFTLNVEKGAKVGVYSLPLMLEYYNHWGTRKSQMVYVTVPLEGKEELSVDVDQPRTYPGSLVKPKISLRNSGTAPIFDVEVRLSSGAQQLSVISGDLFKIPVVLPNQTVDLSPSVYITPTASTGVYQATLSITYKDIKGNACTDEHTLSIMVLDRVMGGVKARIEGNPVTTRQPNNVSIVILNANEGPITSVKASLDTSGLPISVISGDVPALLDRIDEGKEARLKTVVYVSPSATEGIHYAKLNVAYLDSYGILREESLPIPFVVKGIIDLNFKSLEIAKATFTPGETVDITGEVINSGTTTARMAEVSLRADRPLTTTSLSTYYIGDIDPYSTVSFSVSLDVSRDARPGTYKPELVISYVDSFGQRYSVVKPIDVRVVEGQTFTTLSPTRAAQTGGAGISPGQLTLYASIALAAIVVLLAFLLVRARRELIRTKRAG